MLGAVALEAALMVALLPLALAASGFLALAVDGFPSLEGIVPMVPGVPDPEGAYRPSVAAQAAWCASLASMAGGFVGWRRVKGVGRPGGDGA